MTSTDVTVTTTDTTLYTAVATILLYLYAVTSDVSHVFFTVVRAGSVVDRGDLKPADASPRQVNLQNGDVVHAITGTGSAVVRVVSE